MATATTSRVKIVRRGGYADFIRGYAIDINDRQVGTIMRNSVLELEVPSGPLKIEARIDWGRSEPLYIEAPAGKTVAIEVANHWGALLAIWAITFGSKSYLTLKQLGPAL